MANDDSEIVIFKLTYWRNQLLHATNAWTLITSRSTIAILCYTEIWLRIWPFTRHTRGSLH
jgi:hypothetical protein